MVKLDAWASEHELPPEPFTKMKQAVIALFAQMDLRGESGVRRASGGQGRAKRYGIAGHERTGTPSRPAGTKVAHRVARTAERSSCL
jgi:hypothetical protein